MKGTIKGSEWCKDYWPHLCLALILSSTSDRGKLSSKLIPNLVELKMATVAQHPFPPIILTEFIAYARWKIKLYCPDPLAGIVSRHALDSTNQMHLCKIWKVNILWSFSFCFWCFCCKHHCKDAGFFYCCAPVSCL